MKYAVHFMLLFLVLCSPALAASDDVSLTADTMQYDMEAGLFYAEGNVTIKGREMTVIASHAYGQINSKIFNLSGNITISGTWNGDDVQLAATSATAEFAEKPIYTLEAGISGEFGETAIDCEYLQMVGDDITAKNVRKLHDQKIGIIFSATEVNGKIDNGGLSQAIAVGSIIIKGTPDKSGGIVELKGSKAVYSTARGTIVLSGGVSAVQNRRTLYADELVYFPATNRIEAIGKSRITVNTEDENMSSLSSPSNKK